MYKSRVIRDNKAGQFLPNRSVSNAGGKEKIKNKKRTAQIE